SCPAPEAVVPLPQERVAVEADDELDQRYEAEEERDAVDRPHDVEQLVEQEEHGAYAEEQGTEGGEEPGAAEEEGVEHVAAGRGAGLREGAGGGADGGPGPDDLRHRVLHVDASDRRPVGREECEEEHVEGEDLDDDCRAYYT